MLDKPLLKAFYRRERRSPAFFFYLCHITSLSLFERVQSRKRLTFAGWASCSFPFDGFILFPSTPELIGN